MKPKYAPLKSALSKSRCGHVAKFGFSMRLAGPGLHALLDLPALRERIECERKEMTVQVAERLIASGISHNRSAFILGIPTVTLLTWRRRYSARGFEGLIAGKRKPTAPRNLRGSQLPCRLEVLVKL